MAVDIIESFQLSTNQPLDNRYIVNNINDVSDYWYDGMLLYNVSTNQLWIVRDASAEVVEPIEFDQYVTDGSLQAILTEYATILYVDGSIAELKLYTDGSLNLKVNQTLFDSSVASIWTKFGHVDTSLLNLGIKNANQDVSLNNIWVKLGSVDTSLLNLGIKDANQDVSLNNLIIYVDGSLNLKVNQTLFDSSVAAIWTKFGHVDTSLTNLGIKDSNIDISLNNIWIKFGSVDTSLLNLGIKNANQDISINNLIVYTDGSLNNRVRITGDTMTGNLTAPGILVTNDLSVNNHLYVGNDASIMGELCVRDTIHVDSKIHLHQYANINPSDGDLWVDPSTYNLMFKHPILDASGIDASSNDLTNRLLRTENDWSRFPDSSVLVEGDRILIEQSGTGYKKAWISSSAFAQSIGVLSFAAYDASLSISSTTSTALQPKLSLVTDASAKAGIFRIGWTLLLTNSNNTKISRYEVRVADVSIVLDSDSVAFATGEYYLTHSGFQHIYLPDGSHNIVVSFAAVTNTARIKGVRLEYQAAQAQVV